MASAARANKRRTTRAKAKPKPEPEQRSGVAVFITPPDDQGQSQMTVQTLGDTRPTEAPILLEKAIQIARQQLGLTGDGNS